MKIIIDNDIIDIGMKIITNIGWNFGNRVGLNTF